MNGGSKRTLRRDAAKKREKALAASENPFDRNFLSLRCMTCDNIWNGPHAGEVVRIDSQRYHQISEENKRNRARATAPDLWKSEGGISDATCNKRSCIDKSAAAHTAEMRSRYPERDWSEYEYAYILDQYAARDAEPERFPGGLIDDVEPPLGASKGVEE